MQHMMTVLSALIVLSACASQPKSTPPPAGEASAEAPGSAPQATGPAPTPEEAVSLKEKLQTMQNTVYALEDKIYGVKKLGTLGLYGELKNCRRKLASRQYGGTGDLLWTEPMDRVT